MIFDNLRSTRPFKAPPRMITLHWTAGVASDPMHVVNAMRARKGALTPDGLSVHYVIGKTGQVLQTASLDRRCLHAGGVNDSSIGIEVSCPGFPKGAYDREPENWTTYRDTVKGRRVIMVDYRPEQYAALRDVLLHIRAETGIPLTVPVESDGRLVTRQMTKAELGSFRGVIGHYHASKTKVDCGTRPLLWVQGRMKMRDVGRQPEKCTRRSGDAWVDHARGSIFDARCGSRCGAPACRGPHIEELVEYFFREAADSLTPDEYCDCCECQEEEC